MAIGCTHILAFYFLWLLGEVSLKVSRFRMAWRSAKARVHFARQGTSGLQETETIWVPPNGTQFVSLDSERRSLCVLCCTIFHWLEYLLPVCLALVTFVCGLMLDRGYLAEVGAVAAALLFFVMLGTHESLDQLGDQQRCTPPFIKHCFRHPEVLQYWGERWCRLGFNAQKRQRYPFAIVVGLTALVFGSFRLMSLTYACMCMMLYVCLRLLWMRVEGYGGWFYAFLESFVEIILLNIIIMMTSRNPLRDGAVVLILAVMRQFGFQREINSGERVRLASMITLGLVQVMLLGLVCFALSSVSDDNWSAFGEYMGSTKFYEIPHLPPNMTQKDVNTFPLCLVRFPHGAVGSGNALDFSKELSLADFGLMASLTYEHLGRESSDGIHGEPPSRVEEGCAHYFPNWHVEQKPP
ncbi:unnamed protein product, partial [Cladocopium goreaui]